MRIVGGEFRGRRLAEPANQAIRPTTDRNRESLFNILLHGWRDHLEGKAVIDGFAGTGALGLEALSRGAEFVTFIEKDAKAFALIEKNIAALRVEDSTRIMRCDATRPGRNSTARSADLVFLDPPYGKALGEKAAAALLENGWIKVGGLLLLEEAKASLPATLPGYDLADQRGFGETSIGLFVAKATL